MKCYGSGSKAENIQGERGTCPECKRPDMKLKKDKTPTHSDKRR